MRMKDLLQESGVDHNELYRQLGQYFEISARVASESDHIIYCNLKNKFEIKTMPVKLDKMFGTLTIDSGLESLQNMPKALAELYAINLSANFRLVSDAPTYISHVRLENVHENFKDLSNSGNISVRVLSLKRCPGVSSMAGLKSLGCSKVNLFDIEDLRDDLSKYSDVKFELSTIPHKLPLVNLIAYHNVSGFGHVTESTMFSVLRLYPKLRGLLGQGAQAVMPLIRYFQSQEQPYRCANS